MNVPICPNENLWMQDPITKLTESTRTLTIHMTEDFSLKALV